MLLGSLFLLASALSSAQPVKPASPPGAPAPPPQMQALVEHFTGEPVVAVGHAYSAGGPEVKPEGTLLSRLQALSEAVPGPVNIPIIPFKIRGTWVLAPETRQEVNPNASSLTPIDASGRTLMLNGMLLSFPPSVLRPLGSDEGIPFAQLPPDAQAILARVIRPPMEIREMVPHEWKDDNGQTQQGRMVEKRGDLNEDLAWGSVRIRAQLSMNNALVSSGQRGASYISLRNNASSKQLNPLDRSETWRMNEVDLQALLEEPNTFKPSDLEGRRLTMPFGAAGPMTLRQAMDQVTKVTRLRFYLSDAQNPIPVFVGAATVPCGDVLDGIRLGLNAAWRKIGDGYVLAWDRRGLAALQQMVKEQTAEVRKSVRRRQREVDQDVKWLDLAETLAFSPSDPLALTDAQRRTLIDRPMGEAMQGIPFNDLTSKQQEALRRLMQNQTFHVWDPDNPNNSMSRLVDENDIQRASLGADLSIRLSLNIPGHGWVDLPDEWNVGSLQAYRLQRARRKATGEKSQEIPPEGLAFLENPKPVALPAASRGVVVPPIRTARLNLLAQEMKNRGLDVLFYPVLSGGYATFPTKYFPMYPGMDEGEGFAAALKAMKPAGITVVGYVSLLAWQPLGQNAHWLSRHKDWIDVDPLGRTRLEWLAGHPDVAAQPLISGLVPSNFVRPAQPEVTARLKGLLADFAALKDNPGIAFTDWSTRRLEIGMDALTPPPLGYALPERWDAIQRTGSDPVDGSIYPDIFVPRDREMVEFRPQPENRTDPHVGLLASMLTEAKRLRPDWKTYTVSEVMDMSGRSDTPKEAKPDVTISSLFAMGRPGGTDSGLLLPATEKNLFQMMMDMGEVSPEEEGLPDKIRSMPGIALYHMVLTMERDLAGLRLPLVLYDFRGGADLISPSMAWIGAPEGKPAATPAPVRSPAEPAAQGKAATGVR